MNNSVVIRSSCFFFSQKKEVKSTDDENDVRCPLLIVRFDTADIPRVD